ncbi:MAG: hypothetical protein RL308_637, partial [Bacteroidota bacterium]
ITNHSIVANPLQNIPKKDKPDFEAIASFENSFYIFGSGSTEKRNKMLTLNATTKEAVATDDLSGLYSVMQNFGGIKPEDFNIEGAIYNGTNWYLFNRGNGKSKKNIVFTITGKNLTDEFTILSNAYKLPKIKGVQTSFTDAVAVENKIYFLATAENTQSTYDDGIVLGSLIGCIDTKTMKIDFTLKISENQKFEGITVFKNAATTIEFLLCEDSDSDELKSDIYKLSIIK